MNNPLQDQIIPTPIDIIVPVFKGLEQTQRCLESVLASPNITPTELVVVNDDSPEPEIRAWLQRLAADDSITLLVNQTNLGFVRSVNRAMMLHPERDAILLNSDCEVSGNWVDRLAACIATHPAAATATPLSNNATICSYPHIGRENDLPPGWPLAELDQLCAKINTGKHVEIPTAVGSCMYLKRHCWTELAGFDAETFGRGYGEECDYSMRAAAMGWSHLLCADVFVFHEGSVSFGDTRLQRVEHAEQIIAQKHPDYGPKVAAFVRADPAIDIRTGLSMERARRSTNDAGVVVAELKMDLVRCHEQFTEQVDHLNEEAAARERALAFLDNALNEARTRGNDLDEALAKADRFVKDREADIQSVSANLELAIQGREQALARLLDLEARFNRTLDQRLRSIARKTLKFLRLK